MLAANGAPPLGSEFTKLMLVISIGPRPSKSLDA